MLGSRTVIAEADLDHIAVATESWADAWPRYIGDLGGVWVGGGPEVGFSSAQVRFANEMRLEVLEPYEPERNDFLRRFLDHSGPGPHHLTFKVPDIVAALKKVDAAGYRPIGVNLEHPDWKEAFLHPKDGPGVVIQIAQSSGNWTSAPPPALPEVRAKHPATLDRVTHAVANLDEGLRLFQGLLGGAVVDVGDDETNTWVELRWPGPGRVRVAAPASASSPLSAWLGDRRGRIHHIAFTLPGAPNPGEVAPDDNLGVRLLIAAG
jgi:methylmalonyl-CoA/ethylmalonyl-CoA epimerase